IGEKAGLFQAPPLNGITLSSGDQLVFKAYIKMSISACFTIRIQVMNDRNRQKFHKTIRPLDVGGDASAVIGDDYQHFSSLVTLTIPANYVSFKFINKSVMGKTLLDDVSIMYYPASTGMYPALIP
ncbi:MAG TPA: hypothetical protein VHL11_15645, partial [Phototrophicaceae bacterium]|nr:hypothetical protein [Phototrophicaceae bacterium]